MSLLLNLECRRFCQTARAFDSGMELPIIALGPRAGISALSLVPNPNFALRQGR